MIALKELGEERAGGFRDVSGRSCARSGESRLKVKGSRENFHGPSWIPIWPFSTPVPAEGDGGHGGARPTPEQQKSGQGKLIRASVSEASEDGVPQPQREGLRHWAPTQLGRQQGQQRGNQGSISTWLPQGRTKSESKEIFMTSSLRQKKEEAGGNHSMSQ